jgi:hypothetical protein
MVNNSTKINKTNNRGINSLKIIKNTTYEVGNTAPGLGPTQNCGGVKPFMKLDLLREYIYRKKNDKTPAQIIFNSKRAHTNAATTNE